MPDNGWTRRNYADHLWASSFQAHMQARKKDLSFEAGKAEKLSMCFLPSSISASTSERRKRSERS